MSTVVKGGNGSSPSGPPRKGARTAGEGIKNVTGGKYKLLSRPHLIFSGGGKMVDSRSRAEQEASTS